MVGDMLHMLRDLYEVHVRCDVMIHECRARSGLHGYEESLFAKSAVQLAESPLGGITSRIQGAMPRETSLARGIGTEIGWKEVCNITQPLLTVPEPGFNILILIDE